MLGSGRGLIKSSNLTFVSMDGATEASLEEDEWGSVGIASCVLDLVTMCKSSSFTTRSLYLWRKKLSRQTPRPCLRPVRNLRAYWD
jgi:hypothetical protein